ncbi:hypothetical protein PSACC_03094 [Paramicrosporidium saccamoebae]|uniref:DNA polymerase V n=1 Tax=Paramicrosporidium saccamoebae TaxID=1246581 RepID=A0A2H9TH98_9FUNG|nr:hypothetical protein PSACC_03094 [Paramicrosporidium saccamoebae]
MTVESPVSNAYGVPEQLPQLLSSLMNLDAPLEAIAIDILSLCDSDCHPTLISKTTPFLYEQGELKGKCSVGVTYTLKRLIRGLASISAHTKLSYAFTLVAVLQKYQNDLPAPVMLSWIRKALSKDAVSGDSRMNLTEESAMFSGKLLAFNALAAYIPVADISKEMIVDCMGIWKSKDGLCYLAQSTIVDILSSIDEKVRNVCLAHVECVLADEGFSAKAIALVLALRSKFSLPSFAQKIAGFDADFSQPIGFLPLLSCVDANHLDSPSAFALYRSLLVSLSGTGAFKQCWLEISQTLMHRAKLGEPVLQKLLADLISLETNDIQDLLSESIIEFLVKNSQQQTFNLKQLAVENPSIAVEVLRTCVQENATDFASNMLSDLSVENLDTVLSATESMELSAVAETRLADLHLHLLKPGSPFLSSVVAIQSILSSLVSMKLERQDADSKISSRVQSALVKILSLSHLPCDFGRDKVLSCCLGSIDKHFDLSSKSGKKNFEALDDPVKDAWNVALEITRRVQKRTEKSNLSSDMQCYYQVLMTMTLTGRLLLVLDPLASATIFDDMRECVDRLRKGLDNITDEDHPVDVLVDILVQWQARSSALLRKISDEMFGLLVPFLTRESYESIFRVLTVVPGAENEIMDDDEMMDETEDEMEDEAEDEVEDETEDDDNDSSDDSDAKRPRIATENHIESSEPETMDIQDADPKELELLDMQLSAIMTARKTHQSANDVSRQNLIHFKQRLCDWLQIIVQKSLPEQHFSIKVKMIPTLLEVLRIHSVSKDKVANTKYSKDKELVGKVTSIFDSFYSKPPAVISDEARAETAALLKSLTQSLSENVNGSPMDLRRSFLAFWYVFSGNQHLDAGLNDLLHPIWIKFIKGGDKSHDVNFLSFFEQLRFKSPSTLIQLVSSSETMDLLATSRLYTREKIIRFVEPVLKKPLNDDILKKMGIALFQSLLSMYLSSINPEGFLAKATVAHFRDELPIINSLIAKSRHFIGTEAASLWTPLIDGLTAHVATLKDRIPESQMKSLKDKINSMMALIKSI